MFGIPNPNLTDKTGIRIAEAIESLGGATPGTPTNLYGSGIPDPNITDETGIRIAEALENLEPGGSSLPETTPADAGKVLGVTEDGEWDKMNLPSGGPTVVHMVATFNEETEEVLITCDLEYEALKELIESLFHDASGFAHTNLQATLAIVEDGAIANLLQSNKIDRVMTGSYEFQFNSLDRRYGDDVHLIAQTHILSIDWRDSGWQFQFFEVDLGAVNTGDLSQS